MQTLLSIIVFSALILYFLILLLRLETFFIDKMNKEARISPQIGIIPASQCLQFFRYPEHEYRSSYQYL